MSNLSVLVISEDALTTALLSSLLELEGFPALHLDSDEAAAASVARVRPDVVLLDCDHPAAAADAFHDGVRVAGTKVIIFSQREMHDALAAEARRRGYPRFALPIARAELGALIRRALDG